MIVMYVAVDNGVRRLAMFIGRYMSVVMVVVGDVWRQ